MQMNEVFPCCLPCLDWRTVVMEFPGSLFYVGASHFTDVLFWNCLFVFLVCLRGFLCLFAFLFVLFFCFEWQWNLVVFLGRAFESLGKALHTHYLTLLRCEWVTIVLSETDAKFGGPPGRGSVVLISQMQKRYNCGSTLYHGVIDHAALLGSL